MLFFLLLSFLYRLYLLSSSRGNFWGIYHKLFNQHQVTLCLSLFPYNDLMFLYWWSDISPGSASCCWTIWSLLCCCHQLCYRFLLCGYHQVELYLFLLLLHCIISWIFCFSLAKLLWWDKSVLFIWGDVVRVVVTWEGVIGMRSYSSSPWLWSGHLFVRSWLSSYNCSGFWLGSP